MKHTTSAAALFFFIIFTAAAFSQSYRLSGKITDAKNNNPIEYVTVKMADSTYGTTADRYGSYFLQLHPGSNTLIFSLIGYYSDTVNVFIENSDITRDVVMRPSEILTETIVVLGEDPAYDIIRKAIKYKKLFRSSLKEYDYDAYTKYVLRSDLSVLKKDSLTEKDKYPIFAILESETRGYYKQPDKYKEYVVSKRETANIPKGIALPYIVNFYDESIEFGDSKITGPLADDALDYYEYSLEKIVSIDSQRVYRIEVIDGAGLFPLFKGRMYIADSTYALLKVDLSANEAALPFGVDAVNYRQTFTGFSDNAGSEFWMPTDVQISADLSVAGLFALQGEGFTIVNHYGLNRKAPSGTFDDYVVKVLPDAKKDSAYWSSNRKVESSKEESRAFGDIDKKTEENKGKVKFNFTSIDFGEYLSTKPLGYYRFNRVEGSHLQFNLGLKTPDRRTELNSYLGYGFSDKKSKYELSYLGKFGRANDTRVNASVYNDLRSIGYQTSGVFQAFNTISSLVRKRDFYDYYYANGWNISLSKLLTPQLGLTLKYGQEKQITAHKNTDYSIFKKDELFSPNTPINNAFQRTVGFSVLIDPNRYKFVDYGDGEESRYSETSFPVLNLGYEITPRSLGSTYEYRRYTTELNGNNSAGRFFNLKYKLGGIFLNGNVPYQSLGYFVGTAALSDRPFTFRTMRFRDYLGDRVYYANLENNFSNIIFAYIKPISKWELIGFANIGKTEITASNYALASSKSFLVTDGWLAEAGFGIGNIFGLLRVDFAWRLNNRDGDNNFRFTLSPSFR